MPPNPPPPASPSLLVSHACSPASLLRSQNSSCELVFSTRSGKPGKERTLTHLLCSVPPFLPSLARSTLLRAPLEKSNGCSSLKLSGRERAVGGEGAPTHLVRGIPSSPDSSTYLILATLVILETRKRTREKDSAQSRGDIQWEKNRRGKEMVVRRELESWSRKEEGSVAKDSSTSVHR